MAQFSKLLLEALPAAAPLTLLSKSLAQCLKAFSKPWHRVPIQTGASSVGGGLLQAWVSKKKIKNVLLQGTAFLLVKMELGEHSALASQACRCLDTSGSVLMEQKDQDTA